MNDKAFICNPSTKIIILIPNKFFVCLQYNLDQPIFLTTSRFLRLKGFLAITMVFNSLHTHFMGIRSWPCLWHFQPFRVSDDCLVLMVHCCQTSKILCGRANIFLEHLNLAILAALVSNISVQTIQWTVIKAGLHRHQARMMSLLQDNWLKAQFCVIKGIIKKKRKAVYIKTPEETLGSLQNFLATGSIVLTNGVIIQNIEIKIT